MTYAYVLTLKSRLHIQERPLNMCLSALGLPDLMSVSTVAYFLQVL